MHETGRASHTCPAWRMPTYN